MALAPSPIQPPGPQVPPLQNGDHLSRDEFERRYAAMPGIKKAELIEGVVYMPSPVHFNAHSEPHAHITTWLGVYKAATPGVRIGTDGSIRLDLDNEPQPDVLLMLPPSLGGQTIIDTDDYVAGAPELVVEVAASTVSMDLHKKRVAYRRKGVREYVVWRVLDREVDWFVLQGGEYVLVTPPPDGIYRSEVFPGLWLDPRALIQGDLAGVLRVLQQGIGTPEHAEFATRVASAG